MEFLISDTFTDSLTRLTGDEQKAVKMTVFDLQVDPSNPGMSLHRIDNAKDKNFWSIRVNSDLRIIIHKTESSFLLCHVNHHEEAYNWAMRRKIEAHPTTGAAQLVEIRETVKEITVPKYVENIETHKSLLFANIPDKELLNYGVPQEWFYDIRNSDEDSILSVAEHLPAEAAEALLDLATGKKPQILQKAIPGSDPFTHPDAQRRFRTIENIEELKQALEYPWEKWAIFLHPTQRTIITKTYNGPTRVSGSAGTGKTIVALHRAVYLTRNNPETRVLLTTFSEPLANALRKKLRCLLHHEPVLGERIEVIAINTLGKRLTLRNFGKQHIVTDEEINKLLADASTDIKESRFTPEFIRAEWLQIIDTWQLSKWEEYRDFKRLGRLTRLTEPLRKTLWNIFDTVLTELRNKNWITESEMFFNLANFYKGNPRLPFDFAVVDESQDFSVAQLHFLSALGAGRINSLFFAGDIGQRIFQQAFSWKAAGIDIRGRAQTLKINYRTSHQIRKQADLLLSPEISDVDGNVEERKSTISVFNGPKPEIIQLETIDSELDYVNKWLTARRNDGVLPHEIGVFVRSSKESYRAQNAVSASTIPFKTLDKNMEVEDGFLSISTMHLAKGLEFRAVVVMACDNEIIPSQDRIESTTDESELKEIYDTERYLLYVACTRARDYLLVTSGGEASEFLDDLAN